MASGAREPLGSQDALTGRAGSFCVKLTVRKGSSSAGPRGSSRQPAWPAWRHTRQTQEMGEVIHEDGCKRGMRCGREDRKGRKAGHLAFCVTWRKPGWSSWCGPVERRGPGCTRRQRGLYPSAPCSQLSLSTGSSWGHSQAQSGRKEPDGTEPSFTTILFPLTSRDKRFSESFRRQRMGIEELCPLLCRVGSGTGECPL